MAPPICPHLLTIAPSPQGIAAGVDALRRTTDREHITEVFGVVAVDGNWLVVDLLSGKDPASGRPLVAAWHGPDTTPASAIGADLARTAANYAAEPSPV